MWPVHGSKTQTAVALLIWETQRKAREDEEKKVAAAAERIRINELHEKHMEAEKVRNPAWVEGSDDSQACLLVHGISR